MKQYMSDLMYGSYNTLKFWESGSKVTWTPSLKFLGSEIMKVSVAWEDFSFLNILEKLPFLLMLLMRTWACCERSEVIKLEKNAYQSRACKNIRG